MGRVKGKCKVPECIRDVVSLGKRGGGPYYSNQCSFHRKQGKRERKVQKGESLKKL